MAGGEVKARSKTPKVRLWLAQSQRALGSVVGEESPSLRPLAMVMFVIQLVGCFTAWITNIMLHGDGAYFVYALSVGGAWMLKWRSISARAAIYFTTVLPTELGASLFHLSPLGIGRLNGFIFYLVPALLFAAACALVWRRCPQYLVFPAGQYVSSTALGYGFPSESLLAPGFLWVALFAIMIRRAPSALFFVAFIGLVFSHEVAIPAAIVAAVLAVQQARQEDCESRTCWRAKATLAGVLGVFALLIAVRLNGGGTGSDSNAIYVVDPRRILNNPSLWIMVLAVIAASAARRYLAFFQGRSGALLLIVGAFVVPLILKAVWCSIDFEQGRYDSTRSIVGITMLVLALCFALVLRTKLECTHAPALDWFRQIPFVLSVALATSAASAVAFLYDWDLSLCGLERVVSPISAEGRPEIISYEQALGLMEPEEASANDRMDFQWVMPYRSILLADGGVPARVVVIDGDYRAYCAMADRIDPSRSAIPTPALAAMHEFSCTHIPPPSQNTQSRRLLRYLSNEKDQIFGTKVPSQ
jgi:hypothetical protein